MLFHRDNATVIRKLRLACPPEDRFQEMQRLERALAAVVPGSSRFPPSAIIYMRKLQVADAVRGGSMVAWSTSVQKTLDQLLQQAARPAQGPVPSSAPAVWFMDRAEWLACLSRDWLHGQLGLHWWWQTVLPPSDQETAVVTAWQEAAAFMPAALEHLAQRGEVLPFVRRLPDPTVHTLLVVLAQAFALPLVMAAGQPAADQAPGWPAQARLELAGQLNEPSRSAPPIQEETHESPLLAPAWLRVAPECRDPGLKRAQALFVAIGLALRRRPVLLREPGQLAALQKWWHHSKANERVLAPDMAPVGGTGGELRSPSGPLERLALDSEKPSPKMAPAEEDRLSSVAPKAAWAAEEITDPERAIMLAAGDETVDPGAPAVESTAAAVSLMAGEPTVKETVPAWRTRWGGLFYLANLLLYLELYHDLGAYDRPDLAMPFWDLLALIGRQLIGPGLEDDPLWELLATWSGRGRDERPGQAFEAPAAWQMPPTWLRFFDPEDVWLWDQDADRLWIWHPAGSWLADLPRQDRTLAEWRTAVGHDQTDETLVRAKCPKPRGRSALDRWLDWHLAYMSARLRLALGLDQETDLAGYLFRHEARFTDTGTEIDVYFSLTTLPVAVRYAGLDRDPGWIPASGRRLTFHFEVDSSSVNLGHVDPII